ncbi:nitroreductase [Acidocella facilis]|uniref:nitroreductase n=1 Tax=Acidocella facilis TaxID=525 RepID=UPI001F471DD0|nr:nitroreductase [Acidocella facilis]
MSVTEAVNCRMSVRAFLPKPVSRETVFEILEVARRTPSGGNLQPWHVHVLAGAVLDEFRALVVEQTKIGVKETPQYEVYPKNLWEPHRSYRFKTGEDMYACVGVAREDKAGRLRQFAKNYAFFDAPVGLFFSLDRRFGPPQWSDMGMLMQTIMLLAVERGLGTCSQECWNTWPDTVGEFLGLEAHTILLGGMALGYTDESAPINKLQTARAELADFCTIRGL